MKRPHPDVVPPGLVIPGTPPTQTDHPPPASGCYIRRVWKHSSPHRRCCRYYHRPYYVDLAERMEDLGLSPPRRIIYTDTSEEEAGGDSEGAEGGYLNPPSGHAHVCGSPTDSPTMDSLIADIALLDIKGPPDIIEGLNKSHDTGPQKVSPTKSHDTGPENVSPAKSHDTGPKRVSPAKSHGTGPKRVSPAKSQDTGPQRGSPTKSHDTGPKRVSPAKSHDTGTENVSPAKSHDTGPKRVSPTKSHGTGPQRVSPAKSHDTGPQKVSPAKSHDTGPQKVSPTKSHDTGPQKASPTKSHDTGPQKVSPTKSHDTGPQKVSPTKSHDTGPQKVSLAKSHDTGPQKVSPTKSHDTGPQKVSPTKSHDTGPQKVSLAKSHDTGPQRGSPAKSHDTGPQKVSPAKSTKGIPQNRPLDQRSHGAGSAAATKTSQTRYLGAVVPEACQVPPPLTVPQPEPLTHMDHPQVVFDLETTGFGHRSHITQIGAVSGTDKFSRYVMPKVPIHPEASKATEITVRKGKMYYKDQLVDAVPLKQALCELKQFLGPQPVLLVGHNVKAFDAPVLLYASRACGVDLRHLIHGFLDTLLLFRTVHPGLESYKQSELYQHFFPNKNYDAHNALADVVALQTLVATACPDPESQCPFTFDMRYVSDALQYRSVKKHLLDEGWNQLIKEDVVSKGMGEKAAGSGLGVEHLKQVYKMNGDAGVSAVLSELVNGKPRVTETQRIIDKIIRYFELLLSNEF